MRSLELCLLVGCLLRPNVAEAASIPSPNSENHGDSFGYESRIVGGQTTSISFFPYQVSVQENNGHVCGGSILKPNVVITAAHCILKEVPVTAYKVRVGSTQHAFGGQLVDVRRIIVHEKYSDDTKTYDVALLQLADELQYTDSIQPVQLPEADVLLPAMTPLYVSGWGLIKEECGSPPTVLRYVEVQAIDQHTCEENYRDHSHSPITPAMLCAGSADKDACQGDSGGPAVSIGADWQRTLQGIVSWGAGCGIKGYPGVYTNVAVVRPWIDDKLAELGANV